MKKTFYYLTMLSLAGLVLADPLFAAETDGAGSLYRPLGIALTMGLAAIGGTHAQGKAVSSALDSIGRNPSVGTGILVPMILGLALIESLVILAFVICQTKF